MKKFFIYIFLLFVFSCSNDDEKISKALERCADRAYIENHPYNLLSIWGDIFLGVDEDKAIKKLKNDGFKGSLKDAREEIKYKRLRVAIPRFKKATINEKAAGRLYIDEYTNCEKQRKKTPKSFDLEFKK